MRFGPFTSMGAQTWSGVLDLWRHLEATRWDIACVTDHFMPNTNEHEAYSIPFYTMRERLERLDEACQVIRSLWTERRVTFKGNYYQLSDAPLDPKPVQTPHPELMIGGGGERVTLRIVAKHADHWNCWGGPRVLARKGKILDDHCAALGSDPRPAPPAPVRAGRHALHSEHVPSAGRAAPGPRSVHHGDRAGLPVRMPRPLAGQVQTVLGAVAPDAIGIALPHEHLLIDFKVMFAEPVAAGDKGRAWEPVSLANLGWVRQNFNANLDNLRLVDEQVAQ